MLTPMSVLWALNVQISAETTRNLTKFQILIITYEARAIWRILHVASARSKPWGPKSLTTSALKLQTSKLDGSVPSVR
jgi:hypothetical protein